MKCAKRNEGFMAHLIDLICLSISYAEVRQRMLSAADALGSRCSRERMREWIQEGIPEPLIG